MRYNTCFNCAVDHRTCEVRKRISHAIKGLGIHSVKFRCDARQPMFRPGQRVSFHWSFWDNGEFGEPCALPMMFAGTVIRETKTKFTVQVDSGPDFGGEGIDATEVFNNSESLLIRVRPADMTALAEPDQRVCQTCSWAEGRSEPRCYANDYYHNPPGCQHPAETAEPAAVEATP